MFNLRKLNTSCVNRIDRSSLSGNRALIVLKKRIFSCSLQTEDVFEKNSLLKGSVTYSTGKFVKMFEAFCAKMIKL